MKLKRIIALLLTAVLLLSTSACTTIVVKIPAEYITAFKNIGSVQNNQPTAAAPTAPNVDTPTAAPSADTPTAAPSTPETPTAAPSTPETPTAAPSTPEATTAAPAGNKMPTTKDEVIAYYVTAYNKIAKESKKITLTYDYTSNYNDILKIGDNATLKSLAGSLMKQFMVENTEAQVKTAAELPPVGVTAISIPSNLISSATCVDKGTYYEVTLKSTGTDAKYEIDSVAGKGSAGVIGPLLRSEDVAGAAKMIKFEGLHTWYATASVVAKIDKATGHITDFSFLTPSVLHFDKVTVAILSVEDCDIGLLFQQKYTVAY